MIKYILAIIFLCSVPAYSNDVCRLDYMDIKNVVERMNWKVTSTTGGRHNKNSKHYIGKAVDVSVRGKTDFDVAVLFTVLENIGFIVKDERVRPKGQKVWGGAHIHISVPYCN